MASNPRRAAEDAAREYAVGPGRGPRPGSTVARDQDGDDSREQAEPFSQTGHGVLGLLEAVVETS